MSEVVEHTEDRRTTLACAGLGALLIVAAVLALVQAVSVRSVGSSFVLGPGFFPLLIGILLALVGGTLVVRAALRLRSASTQEEEKEEEAEAEDAPRGRLVRIGVLLVLLVVFAVLLPFAGYVVSSALLFTGTALLLGSPHRWRTLAAGWTLAAVVFLAFDRLIGLTLPTGPWGF
jgi:putative tricarboxylic transport membrane protein